MKITANTKICMVIGDPVGHSLSPQIHNAGYEDLGIDADYVYVACNVRIEKIEDFVKGVRALGIRGVNCTIPHKLEVMNYLDEVDEVAKKIGAVNAIMNNNGILKGYNTDWLGVVLPLENITTLKNKNVALIGAGGAARAAAYGLTLKGAKLMVYNRTIEKAEELAREFGGQAQSLTKLDELKRADIIVNTTSVGLHPHEDETPVPSEYITNNHIVFDAVYTSTGETRLIQEAKNQKATTISGKEMLLYQGFESFKLFTGYGAPKEVMRKALV